ncbi:PH domain-containing protein [Actinomyces minihominis]|uniref:PH domain-containing protein n=1 Tax=Actinomyces minihominis TaxID=2002838 RepID=UPI000C086D2A|nr:PH domain-containing protein [Actinomyces minihominis]
MVRERSGVVEAGVDPQAWKRVSPITPVLNSWQAIAILIAVVVFQNLEQIQYVSQLAGSVGVGRLVLYFLAGVAAVVLIVAIYSYLYWRAMTYAVTDQAVWLRRGIIFRQQRHVRLERIQAVDVTHPLLGRIFGLGRLKVEAAGGGDSSLQIGFLRSEELSALRADILARAAGVHRGDSQAGSAATDAPVSAAEGEESGSVPQTPALAQPREASESLLYAVNARTLATSLALSLGFMVGILIIVAFLAAILIIGFVVGWEVSFAVLPGTLAPILVIGAALWSRFAKEFNFQAAVSPDGIRIRSGLLELKAETIPPRRIHAVKIIQPLLWRKRNWYRVEISQATGVSSSQGTKNESYALLPVGTREEAMLALWLVLPDLGVEDPVAFFDEAVRGLVPASPFSTVPHSARLLDPLVKKRRGIALTKTCVVVRDGRITRVASFTPYERVQSVRQEQGPIERRLGLTNVTACLVPGPVQSTIYHLDVATGVQIREELDAKSRVLRASEPPERWFERVQAPTQDREWEEEGTRVTEVEERLEGSGSEVSDTRFAPVETAEEA